MSLGINIDLEEKILNNPNHIDLIFSIFPYGDQNIIKDNLKTLSDDLSLAQNNIDFSYLRNFIINSANLTQMDYNKEKLKTFTEITNDIHQYVNSLDLIIRKTIDKTVNTDKEKDYLIDLIDLNTITLNFKSKQKVVSDKFSNSMNDENLYISNLEMLVKNIKTEIINNARYAFKQLKKTLNIQEKIKVRIDIQDSIENLEITYLNFKEIIFGEINFSEYKKLIDIKIHDWLKSELGDSISYISSLKTSPFTKGKEYIIKEMSVQEFLEEYQKINNIWNEYFEKNDLQEKILLRIKLFKNIKKIYYNDLNVIRKKIEDKLILIDSEFKKLNIEDISSKEILDGSYNYNLGYFLLMDISKELENITSEILSGESMIVSKNIPFFLAQKMNKEIANKLKKSLIIQMSKNLEFNFKKQYNKKFLLKPTEINNQLIKNIDYTHEYNLFLINQDQDDYTAKSFEKKLNKLSNKKTMAFMFRDIEINDKLFNIDCVFDKKTFYHKDIKSLKHYY